MSTTLGRSFAMASSLLAAALLLPACADDESSFFVRGVMVEDTATCTVTADPSGLMRFRGVLDAAFAGEYNGVVLVGNQLVKRGDDTRLRTETSRISIYALDVQILNADLSSYARADNSTAEYTVQTSGFVDPGTGTDPGYGLAGGLFIDGATVKDIGTTAVTAGPQDVVSSIVVRGRTLGGNEVQTAPFQFPITICYGCLLAFPAAADDPKTPGVDCLKHDDNPDPNCRIGLDRAVDCRLCSADPMCQMP